MGEMDAYKDIFLSESAEFMQGITDGLLALESDPGDLEPVETVFRGAHSLKGMAAAMGYDRTSELTHRMESLMDRVRKRERKPDAQLTDLMLEVCGSSLAPVHTAPDWTAGTIRTGRRDLITSRLGWRPTVDLADGLQQVWMWIQEREAS